MKFANEDFSNDEKETINQHFSWMEAYYSPLVGATVESVSISIESEPTLRAFPCLTFKLKNGVSLETELTSLDDTTIPGVILGLNSFNTNN